MKRTMQVIGIVTGAAVAVWGLSVITVIAAMHAVDDMYLDEEVPAYELFEG